MLDTIHCFGVVASSGIYYYNGGMISISEECRLPKFPDRPQTMTTEVDDLKGISGGSRISERVVPKNVGMLCTPKFCAATPTYGGYT